MPRGVDQTAPRGREQPRVGIGRDALAWPGLERRDERVAERVLGGRDITPRRRQIGDQSAIRRARR